MYLSMNLLYSDSLPSLSTIYGSKVFLPWKLHFIWVELYLVKNILEKPLGFRTPKVLYFSQFLSLHIAPGQSHNFSIPRFILCWMNSVV